MKQAHNPKFVIPLNADLPPCKYCGCTPIRIEITYGAGSKLGGITCNNDDCLNSAGVTSDQLWREFNERKETR